MLGGRRSVAEELVVAGARTGQYALMPELAEGRVVLWDGWSLGLPNACMEARNADGSWSAWDDHRTIDVHIISTAGRADGSSLSPDEMLGARPTMSGGGWVGTRESLIEEGVHRFAITAAATNTLLSCWVASRDPADEAWARRVEAGLQHDYPRTA